jgi:sulfur carrier protein ThiS
MNNLPIPVDSGQLRVVACPNPFQQANEEWHLCRPGQSLAEILWEVAPEAFSHAAHVWVDDDPVPRSRWEFTFPRRGAEIALKVIPQGPVGRTIGAIFIAIAAIVTSVLTYGALAPAWYAGLAGGLAGLTVGIVGNLALNALFPPVAPQALENQLGRMTSGPAGSLDSPTYALTASSNQARKWGPVGKVLGRTAMSRFTGTAP